MKYGKANFPDTFNPATYIDKTVNCKLKVAPLKKPFIFVITPLRMRVERIKATSCA